MWDKQLHKWPLRKNLYEQLLTSRQRWLLEELCNAALIKNGSTTVIGNANRSCGDCRWNFLYSKVWWQYLCSFQINTLSRWEIIDVIRTLSTQAAKARSDFSGEIFWTFAWQQYLIAFPWVRPKLPTHLNCNITSRESQAWHVLRVATFVSILRTCRKSTRTTANGYLTDRISKSFFSNDFNGQKATLKLVCH